MNIIIRSIDRYVSILSKTGKAIEERKTKVNSLGGQTVRNLSAMWETQVRFLCWEVPLEKGMATQYSCLENSMDRGAWWATVRGFAKVSDTTNGHTLTKWGS